MRKILNKFILFLLIFLVFNCNTIIMAADSYTINNDGKEKSKKEVYVDSKLPSSFRKVKYYDCQIPYKLVPNDIGGWATKVTGNANYGPMSEDDKKNKNMGSYINWQNDYTFKYGGTQSYESDTGCILITDKNGTQYYVTAIQGYFYNSSNVGKNSFPAFSIDNRGQLFDVILTDGTVIHFCVGDANSSHHTNGGVEGKVDKGEDSGSDGVWYFSKVKMKQYKNLFAAQSANQIEIWGHSGCAEKFQKKYNIGTGKKNVQIAYYRMYNKKISDAPKVATSDCKKKSYKLSISGIKSTSSNGVTSTDKSKASTDGISFANTGMYSESEFIDNLCLVEEDLDFSNSDDLSKDQLKSITDWKNNIDYENEDGILKFIRVVVMFMGILFLVWMLFIYLCYWMDRINNFVDIDFLPMVTGGRLRVSPEEHECTFNPKNFVKGQPQTVNHRAVLSICLIGIFFAVLVITGKLYDVINFLVRKILGWLGLV